MNVLRKIEDRIFDFPHWAIEIIFVLCTFIYLAVLVYVSAFLASFMGSIYYAFLPETSLQTMHSIVSITTRVLVVLISFVVLRILSKLD